MARYKVNQISGELISLEDTEDILSFLPHKKEITVSTIESTGTIGGMDYTYKQEILWSGMTDEYEARVYFSSGSYEGDFIVMPQTDKCVVYFESNPSELTSIVIVANNTYSD